jgi:hypothetical protein
MQTIEEYKAYTKQLEGEVGKWYNAYKALMAERNALVKELLKLNGGKSVIKTRR